MSEPLMRLVWKPPLCDFTAKVMESLRKAPPGLGLYQRGGSLVRVIREDGDLPEGIERPPEAPVIRIVGAATLRNYLSRCGDYQRITRTLRDGTEVTEPCHPPQMAVDDVLAAGAWPVPRLEGVVEAPVLLRSGRVLQTPGYDPYSGLLYLPPEGVKFLPVPERPTAGEITSALHWLHEAVYDFPFEKPAHRSAWMAGVLSYFARWAYSGPTPLFMVDGNVRGAGKGKLVNAAAHICIGRKPMVKVQTDEDRDEKELITSVALSGELMVLIDNISRPFGSAPLDSALGEAVWNPTLKYKNESSHFALRAIWWGNGNNVEFRKHCDTVRRTVKIRIESPHENPELRDDFKRPEPQYGRWLRQNRPHLVWAALTLLRGFQAAGSPTQGLRKWGTFEGWSELVRGTLVWANEPDPYEVAASHEQTADQTVEALGELLRGWRALCTEYKAEAMTAQEAVSYLQREMDQRRTEASYRSDHEKLIAAICELKPPKSGRLPDSGELGRLLGKCKKRVVGGLYLEGVAAPGHRSAWAVRGNVR